MNKNIMNAGRILMGLALLILTVAGINYMRYSGSRLERKIISNQEQSVRFRPYVGGDFRIQVSSPKSSPLGPDQWMDLTAQGEVIQIPNCPNDILEQQGNCIYGLKLNALKSYKINYTAIRSNVQILQFSIEPDPLQSKNAYVQFQLALILAIILLMLGIAMGLPWYFFQKDN
ncbi:hypothetical protein MRY82_01230 [bacterium]|nr:hypothetical protein [bacterium]